VIIKKLPGTEIPNCRVQSRPRDGKRLQIQAFRLICQRHRTGAEGVTMMRPFLAASLAGCCLIVAGPCLAATVEPVQGQLSVNHGQGFVKVDGRIDANVGDAVMVSPNGSAVVSYPDGCKIDVQPGAVMTIAPISPCASGSYAAELPVTAPVAAPVAAPVDPYLVVAGAGVLAAIGVGIYEVTRPSPLAPLAPASP
jgi:hypothetical protein